ncbi:MAG: LysM peptidoglycan-binding domain-containing protein [Armatimonadetes bacterium]|nr:LysM peptidoglycan-binding domain-containing protein [Armatimonadota bacterium]
MKKRGCILWGAAAGLLALVALCLAAATLVYMQARNRALESQPLVLIHFPGNHEQVRVGEGVVVHASARSKSGISRVELWADGELLTVRDHPEIGPASPLVLTGRWQTDSRGSHVLLVRAISADGAEGQATVSVEAIGEVEPALGGHLVAEGETIESIAAQYGVDPEELEALNPDLDPGGLAPGYELMVPGGDLAAEEPTAGEDIGDPAPTAGDEPVADGRAPGGPADVAEDMGVPEDWIRHARLAGQPVSLRVEALSLQTDADYEGLHCYIGLAGNPPRWYPDLDGDQATDESFAPLGGGRWDAAEQLAGEQALILTRSDGQPLSLDAACVGIRGSGTDAVELGRLVLEIPHEEWDGVTRRSPEASGEGSFSLEYRVAPADERPHGIPLWLDPSMTAPTDLQLQPRRLGLHWVYRPRGDEEPIDGFRIYLNGMVLWVEPPNSRSTDLPPEWLYPPCGESFVFTVTAFRQGFPDGPESMPAAPVIIEADPERCRPRWIVTFLTLTTYNLGGDGLYEDRSGDVGPAYGFFYANDQQASFDGRNETWGGLGLDHNSEYGVDELTDSATWAGSGPAQFQVELVDGEMLTLGFHIDEENTGRCHDSDDPGCDDLVCEGDVTFLPSLAASEGTIDARAGEGNCAVSYTLVPVVGSPSVESGGGVPLPWLTVEDLAVGEASQVRIHVRNIGVAGWASRDLKVELLRPTAESIAVDTWEDFSLGPGETAILESPLLVADGPVCILLDPDREVAQELDTLEDRGVHSRGPVCMDLPDLVILGVEYDWEAGRGIVTVQNQGEGTLDERTVELNLHPNGGGLAAPPAEHPGITLAPRETAVLTMTAPGGVHSTWFDGYEVTVDPGNEILESDDVNNSFTVPAGNHLELEVGGFQTPYPARNLTEFRILVSADSAGSRPLADWTIQTDEVDPSSCDRHMGCKWTFSGDEYETKFDIAGEEVLRITVYANLERRMQDDLGHTFTWMAAQWDYTAQDNWGAGGEDARNGCTLITEGPGVHRWVLGRYWDYGVTDEDQPWSVTFFLCEDSGGG